MAEREASNRIKQGHDEHQPNGERLIISKRWQYATVVGNLWAGIH